MINIYQNRSRIKIVIVSIALLVGISSMIYTNRIVKDLTDTEFRQISLYAKSQEFIASPEDNKDNLDFLLTEIINYNSSIPVILVEENGDPVYSRNIQIPKRFDDDRKKEFLRQKVAEMREEYEPIPIQLGENWQQYIYYSNSEQVKRLLYYPVVQLTVIAILSILAYLIFSSSRRAEQNRVWVGLAKETAHQLGTPISSLMAWVEFFKSDPAFNENILVEIEKDVERLEMITARFSSIGSEPKLQPTDVLEVTNRIIGYLQKRVSSKVKFNITPRFGQDLTAYVNVPLFEWVLENICKNAVDAMGGLGKIDIYLRDSKDGTMVVMDISDTGKGIPKAKIKSVFQPGYTTKKRGWGLGLTLVKRIVENYHNGKILVLRSELNVGTTFRITIPK